MIEPKLDKIVVFRGASMQEPVSQNSEKQTLRSIQNINESMASHDCLYSEGACFWLVFVLFLVFWCYTRYLGSKSVCLQYLSKQTFQITLLQI